MAAVEDMRDYKLCLLLKKNLGYQILAGSKTYESRLAQGPETTLMKLQVGDVVAFHWCANERISVKIQQVQQFQSVEEMLRTVPPRELLPGHASLSLQDLVVEYQKILRFKAGEGHQMIVFKIGEPLYHADVQRKTKPPKSKKNRKPAQKKNGVKK